MPRIAATTRTAASSRATAASRTAPTKRFLVDIPVTDTFTRADSASTLGSTETGSLTWTSLGTSWGISSNKAYAPGASTDGAALVDFGSPNFDMTTTVSTYSGGSNEQGLYFRVVDSSNWWRFVRSGSALLVQRKVAGSSTTVLNRSTVLTFANGDVYRVRAIGNTLTVLFNNKPLATIVDAALNTATKHGFGNATGSANSRFVAFSIG